MSSSVWQYFTIDPNNVNYAKCNLCHKLISRAGTSKSTSNLRKHLKNAHRLLSSLDATPFATASVRVETKNKPSAFDSQKPPASSSCVLGGQSASETTSESNFEKEENMFISPTYLCQTQYSETSDLDIDTLLSLEIPTTQPAFVAAEPLSSDSEISNTDAASTSTTTTDSFSRGSNFLLSPSACPPNYPKTISIAKRSQLTLPLMADEITKFPHNDSRAVTITQLIGKMICLDLQPFSIVENKGFRRLINHLEPRYNIPSRKTFSKKVIVEMYNKVHKEVENELELTTHIAVTTEMWTSIANIEFMAVSAHFLFQDENGVIKLKSRCLEVVPFPEISHKADNILSFLTKVFDEWKVSNKVVAVTRDNGADITAAVLRSPFQAVPCVAHTLQLVIKDGLIDNPQISGVIKKSKQLVSSFKHSAKNTKLLKLCQKQLGLPQHCMIQDEPTRWNTTYYMLKRLQEQKEAIVLISTRADVKISTELTGEEWKIISFACGILEIFEIATLQVSKESSTISEIIPMVNTIIHVLEAQDVSESEQMMGLKNDLLSSLNKRFAGVESKKMFAVASLLDPRFKSTPFRSEESLRAAKEEIVNELDNLAPVQTGGLDVHPAPSATENIEEPAKKKKMGFWGHYKEVFVKENAGGEGSVSPREKFEAELNQYLLENTIDPKLGDQVGQYWTQSNYHGLKKLSKKYLCIPPCTVFSERLFGAASNICDTKRNRLDPDKVKMLVFLKCNLK